MRTKRAALMALRAVGLVVGVLAMLVGVAVQVLQTDWGGERLRRQAVTRVNRQIRGHLDIGRLSFGGNRVVVWDASLRDPDGHLVARVARAEVDLSVIRVLHKEIRVTAVTIEAPRLNLVSNLQGINLSRATALRNPAVHSPPRKPRTPEEGWVVRLDGFEVSGGEVSLVAMGGGARETKVHFVDLHSVVRARYAIGNGSLDLTVRIEGQSVLAPVGPIRLSVAAGVHGDVVRFGMDGDVLGGTIEARGNLDSRHLEGADAVVAVAIPRLVLSGYDWGPLRIDGEARPGSIPTLKLLLAIPGIEFTGKGGDDGHGRFAFDGRLALADLGLTAKAVQALTGSDVPPLAGNGQIDFAVGGPMAGAPSIWSGRAEGRLARLCLADKVISGLSIDARTAHLSSQPGQADLRMAIASLSAGTTRLRGIALDVKVREQDISAEVGMSSPERMTLTLAGRLDDDQRGLALEHLALSYPGGRWASDRTARLRFDGGRLSLADLRLLSKGRKLVQVLAVEGAKTGEQVDAHLTLTELRLDLLPAFVADPALHLGGLLDADVRADGALANVRVVTRMRLRQGRYRGFSRIDAKVKATLADKQVDAAVGVDAPFVAMVAAFKLPIDPLAPGAPLDLRVDVNRLEVAEVLRGAALPARGDGRVTLHLRVTGSANNPRVDLTANGRDLAVSRPATVTKGSEPIDVGHARIHATYADRAVRAAIDLSSAHGGSLRVAAGARVDLSYPAVTRPVLVANMPIHGNVVARSFDMALMSRFNERLETMGGRVDADARLAGTVGEPRFIGSVSWKNGEVVATAPRRPLAARRSPEP